MDRDKSAYLIGLFILRMNEIDHMTLSCQRDVLERPLTNTWTKKTLAKRLEQLCNGLNERHSNSAEHDVLKNIYAKLHDLFRRAIALTQVRNQIAHGLFVIDASKPIDPGSPTKFVIAAHGNDLPPIDYNVLGQLAVLSKELSDDISEHLAAVSLERDYIRNKSWLKRSPEGSLP
ncbi:hypothetical protein FHW79_005348 [Azospirillum sp. OGB3]|uniref:hypothetical protein n=1 Tax=Azospirillum sp. OGB3 TaxID=2587012 RepID=UPI0016067485|nr:hypothetical protein [Azospirillum sp. OGB3]MBB3267683.1 hypothetical protein [Azospirillum sp. OGB3]